MGEQGNMLAGSDKNRRTNAVSEETEERTAADMFPRSTAGHPANAIQTQARNPACIGGSDHQLHRQASAKCRGTHAVQVYISPNEIER